MIMVTLKHMRPGMLTMEVRDKEERLFSTKEKAEAWLVENGFYLDHKTFFKGDPIDWCHEGEMVWDHINVDFKEFSVDSDEQSRYKDFSFKLAPWHEGYEM